ncbi:MAG: 3-hydroxyacyl-CoA dehydrogenase NAD-binding domain-containing protein [Bdellovibrio sp.]
MNKMSNENNIAVLRIDVDSRPMNVITREFLESLNMHVEKFLNEPKYKGMILTSDRNEFMAGADLELIRHINDKNECFELARFMQDVLRKMEKSTRPVVAAINGTALGGGLEIALACHHRICLNHPKIQLGLPEVKLGLLPGAGGTQRLPRLIGIEKSIPLILEGRALNPEKSLEAGIIHALATDQNDLMTKAISFIEGNKECAAPWDKKGFRLPGGDVQSPVGYRMFPGAMAKVTETTWHNYPAPMKILSTIYEGLQVPFDRGCEIEARYFSELVTGVIAKSMIRTLFYSLNECNKGAARPKDIAPSKIEKVGILGAGMMGQGIAYATATSGMQVVLKDISLESAQKGKAYTEKLLRAQVENGLMSEAEMNKVLELIIPTADPAMMKGCDLVIEAVTEDRALKTKVTRESEAVMPIEAIFASNTSTLPITGLAKESSRPEQFIGLHFFSPVDKMPLVEIIMGEKSNDKALAVCLDYVRKIKKTPIVVNDGRGFYTSRVFTTYVIEGIKMLTEGISPALIENAGKMAGMPVGPLSVSDEVSLDLIYHIMKQTADDLGWDSIDQATFEVVTKFTKELGRLGRKSGKGFYEYPENGKKYLSPLLKELYPEVEHPFTREELSLRLLTIQALETYRCYDEKILRTARDADIGSIFGWGFPAYTGGTLSYIEQRGIQNFLNDCLDLEKRYGKRFSPPASLKNCKGFYS